MNAQRSVSKLILNSFLNMHQLLNNQKLQSVGPVLARTFFTTPPIHNIQINVTPKEALLDNPPKILVEGLKGSQKVTLWNSLIDDAGLEFSSHAHYIANKDGVVDVCQDVSYGGKYEGLFPEGLVSSLHAAPPTYKEKPKLKWARLAKRKVETPLEYTLKVVDGHCSEGELYSNSQTKQIWETKFIRHVMATGVRRIEVSEKQIRGALFLPPGKGPFPLIIDIQGAEPGTKETRAAMLASYGYAALALPYYNYKDLPKVLSNINVNYFLEAIDFMNNLPEGNSGRIGVMGTSKGGEICLTLCRLVKDIKACITVNSYHVSVDVDYYLNEKLYINKFTPNHDNMVLSMKDGKFLSYAKHEVYSWDETKTLPIEETHEDCQILLTAGDDDGAYSYKSAMALKERMKRLKPEANLSVMIFAGAGHLIDPPFHSHIDAVWNSTLLVRKEDGSRYQGLPHFYGGNPYDNCEASKDLWKRSLALFHKKLVQEGQLAIDKTKLYPPY